MAENENRHSYKRLGEFVLSQPTLLIADPGYQKGTLGIAAVDKCKTGLWIAAANYNKYIFENGGKTTYDKRVASLFVRHESLPSYAVFNHIQCEGDAIHYRGDWSEVSNDIGVDSGQCGFFDAEKYQDNSLFSDMGKCGFGDRWYSHCCDIAMSAAKAGVLANVGALSESGLGDGCYTAYGHKSPRSEEFDALALFFLPDNDK